MPIGDLRRLGNQCAERVKQLVVHGNFQTTPLQWVQTQPRHVS